MPKAGKRSRRVEWSKLDLFVRNGCIDFAKEELSKGADINRRSGQYGYTPLLRAIFRGKIDMVRFLCNRGANVSLCDGQGRTPLYVARLLHDGNPGLLAELEALLKD